jgi:tetratricopeptide (TPR) repeat protein
MVGDSDRHAAALEQLTEWWQDLSCLGINSRAVLVPVPRCWGRTHLLKQFTTAVDDDEARGVVVPVHGEELPDGLGLQAQALRDLFSKARIEHQVAEVLGMDRLGGVVQPGLGVGGLFMSALAAQVSPLLAGITVGAVGKVWDNSPAGQEGSVAKLARQVAALSVSLPIVITLDDADHLELGLAVSLIENLIERFNGQVLVVAAVNPDSELMSTLTSRARYGLTEGRVRTVDVNPSMGYQARIELVTDLQPRLPGAAIRRISQRTQTFAEVFAVASAKLLAELDPEADDAAIVAMADKVIDARAGRASTSELAVTVAWAGGILHSRQAERAVTALEGLPGDCGDVIRLGSLIRLPDPASSPLIEHVNVLTTHERHLLAQAVLDTAVEIGKDPREGLIDKVVAWRAAHRIRADLQDRSLLPSVQCQLVRGLENLSDQDAAYEAAHTALADLFLGGHPGREYRQEHQELSAAVLRLALTQQARHDDPLIDETVAAAEAGGAAVGLEARIWAAIELLSRPGQRERALTLTNRVTAELSDRNDLGKVGNRWRLLMAFHTGRAGYPALSQQLLAPMLTASSSREDEDAARGVLRAVGGRGADTRLQIIGLEAELQALPHDADHDQLNLHHALAADYDDLGDYQRALDHGQHELRLRRLVQGEDHPDTLGTRRRVATWTGESGYPARALQLFQELLPDMERILGPHHPDTLQARSEIAGWTGESGYPARALQLFQELLPDVEMILGRNGHRALTVRFSITLWTALAGNIDDALRLARELLPDQQRVLGPDHPHTLRTRYHVAAWTGKCGHAAEALQLSRDLLSDQERVLGPDHPDTLRTRNGVGVWATESGHPAEALQLFQDLLPDQKRLSGPDHPDTLTTRNNIAALTGQCGHPDKALQLFRELLPDWVRVLGPDHPDTLTTRYKIAYWSVDCEYPAEALRLFMSLLPDQVRVLGRDHPDTRNTRRAIQRLIELGKSYKR